MFLYGGCAVSMAKWGPDAWRRAQMMITPLSTTEDLDDTWDYEAFGEPSADVLAAQEAAAYKTLEAVAHARAQQRKSQEAADPTARQLEALVRAGRLEDALTLAQESLDAVEAALAAMDDTTQVLQAAKLYASAGDMHYWKGVALMTFPSHRCAGGTCRQHAAASFADCVKLGGARAEDAQVYLVEATTDLRGIDGTRPERVKALFDEYSETFEDHLVTALRYEAPTILASAVSRLVQNNGLGGGGGQQRHKLNVTLDVGCGTGLVGKEFRHLDVSDRVYGYDLSPNMIARSNKVKYYDDTAICDARHLAGCAQHLPRPDLVVFADVLCYLDDVDAAKVLDQAGLSIDNGGLEANAIALTVERPDPATDLILAQHKANDWRCLLGSTGRYMHNLDWLVNHLHTLGYDLKWIAELCDGPDCQYPPLRYERGHPVRGAIVIFQRLP